MSEEKLKVILYFDVVSPYSLFGFELLLRYENTWNLDIELKPAFLAGIMHLTNNNPPGANPAKAGYLPKDLMRNSDYFGIPISLPQDFPLVSLTAQRILTAVYLREKIQNNKQQKLLREISRLFWGSYWGDRDYYDISKIENLKQILLNNLSSLQKIDKSLNEEEINLLLSQANSNEVKELLKKTTEEVVSLGTFGLPFYYFPNNFFPPSSNDPLCFFGSDRFELMAYCVCLF